MCGVCACVYIMCACVYCHLLCVHMHVHVCMHAPYTYAGAVCILSVCLYMYTYCYHTQYDTNLHDQFRNIEFKHFSHGLRCRANAVRSYVHGSHQRQDGVTLGHGAHTNLTIQCKPMLKHFVIRTQGKSIYKY